MARFQPGLHSPHLCGPYALEDVRETPSSSGLQVYCDLDGVLADFNKGCLELFPEGGAIAEKIPTHLVTRLSYEEETEMWQRVEQKSDFFLSLDWTADGEELWRWMDWNVVPPPAVLTGLPMGRAGQMAAKQKELWCHERLGAHVAVFCCGTRNKQKFSGKNCVLVDDRGDLREAWEARGGVFIHHTSAQESIRQLREVLQRSGANETAPLRLTSVCWAAQTPAGCFKSKCRYLHVPISKRHRNWIQLWGFVWWHQRMFDDLSSLVRCIRAVYLPEHQAAFKASDMDEQSHGAFEKMLVTLSECVDLGLPLDFLKAPAAPPSVLPPLPSQVKEVQLKLTELVRSLEVLGDDPHLVVAGSMGLGADVGGSDLDLVLCCELEVDPRLALSVLRDALEELPEATELVLLPKASVPLLSFRMSQLAVDVTMNQMSSVRDVLLFRYALRSAGPELAATLRLLKMWIKARRMPGTKQGGFPNLVWLRMAVRFYQESKGSSKRLARDWLRRFMAWAWQGLPTGGSPLTLHGEQEYYSGRLAAGVPSATLLLFVTELVKFLERAPAPSHFGEDFEELPSHAHLCPAGPWGYAWGLFFISRGAEARPQVVLCRVLGILGGHEAELRPCECSECSLGTAMQFISRRSEDWLILALEEDPRRLRVQSALQHSGIKKKTVPASCEEDVLGNTWLLLRPCHLIRRLLPCEDPLLELQRAQQAAASAEWLPLPQAESRRIPRGVLLLCRRSSEATRSVQLWDLDQVCQLCPWMLIQEEAASPEEVDLGGVPKVDLPSFDLHLEKGDDMLGISVEATPEGLRVASVSAKGLVGRHNQGSKQQLAEGALILEINGVVELEAMQKELEEQSLVLRVQPSSLETDDFGRQTLKPLVLPHAEIQGAMPLCRCVGHCRCGLADALGRAREWRRGAPQAALHVANLHPEVTEEMLYSFFKEVAAVATVRVVRDTRSLESEEHGYVNFYTFQDAAHALKQLDGVVLHGRRCLLSWSTRARVERPQAKAPTVGPQEPKPVVPEASAPKQGHRRKKL